MSGTGYNDNIEVMVAVEHLPGAVGGRLARRVDRRLRDAGVVEKVHRRSGMQCTLAHIYTRAVADGYKQFIRRAQGKDPDRFGNILFRSFTRAKADVG
jgi:hypothetical protein